MTSLTNNPHPQAKVFFRVQSTRLADPFEPLNSCLAQSAEGCGFFVSDVISGGLLGHLHMALGTNRQMVVFH